MINKRKMIKLNRDTYTCRFQTTFAATVYSVLRPYAAPIDAIQFNPTLWLWLNRKSKTVYRQTVYKNSTASARPRKEEVEKEVSYRRPRLIFGMSRALIWGADTSQTGSSSDRLYLQRLIYQEDEVGWSREGGFRGRIPWKSDSNHETNESRPENILTFLSDLLWALFCKQSCIDSSTQLL